MYMKTLFLKRLMFIFLLFVACYSSAQSLRSLPFQKRDSTLIRIAKETLKKKAPEYLIENGAPIISKHRVRYLTPAEEKEVPEFSTFYGAKSGQVYYIVEFPQDESIESFDAGFVAQVYIWEDTSRSFSIALGNSLIMDLK